MEIVQTRPARKRLFFALSLLGFGFLTAITATILFLLDPRLSQISPWVTLAISLVALGLLGLLGAGLALAALTTQSPTPGRGLRRWLAMRSMLPMATVVGRLLGIHRDEVRRSFLEVNNSLVSRKMLPRVPVDAPVLVLLPHCLQRSKCRHRVTAEIDACRACGHCDIGELKALRQLPAVHVAVATGGQVARELVKRLRPRAIVAVACERDLTHGICDVAGIPVYGVLNDRPMGPCQDTRVEVKRIEETIHHLRQKGSA